MGWTNSPQYLKHLQKIRSMNPEKRAVTQGLVDELSGIYAGADMQKQLAAMKTAATEKSRERSLGLAQQRLDYREDLEGDRYDLAKKTYRHEKDMGDTAEILGYANIPLAGLTGYGQYKHKQKLTDLYTGLASKV
jgi:hypothetical protein